MANTETNGNGKGSVTWKWVVGVLVGVLMLIASSVLSGMQTDIKALHQNKVDKDQYCRDISEIKDSLKDIQKFMRGRP